MPIPISRRQNLLLAGTVILLGLGIYANSLSGAFLWDDHHYITQNIYIKDARHWPQLFGHSFGSGNFVASHYYRPVHELSYLLDHHCWGLNPFGFHLTNIILHLLVTGLMIQLLQKLRATTPVVVMASLLFLAHPVHVEAVSALAGRGETIVSVFLLLSFIFYLRGEQKSSTIDLPAAGLFYLTALLTKENALIFPLIIGAYHYCFQKPFNHRQAAAILLPLLIYAGMKHLVLQAGPLPVEKLAGWASRVPGFFAAFAENLRLFLWPVDLHFDYGQPVFGWKEGKVLLGLGLLGFFLWTAVKWREKNPLLSFAVAWYLLGLLPYTNVFALYSFMAEHYLYFPSIGFFILAAQFLYSCGQQIRRPLLRWIAGGSILLACSFITVLQNNYWRDPLVFLTQTLYYNPQSAVLYNNLGVEFGRRGKHRLELKAYAKALALDPNDALTYRNRAAAWLESGDAAAARADLRAAIELDPTDLKTYNTLAVIYQQEGDTARAMALFEKILQRNPQFVTAHINLGNIYRETHQPEQAIQHFNQALELDRHNAEIYFGLALVYLDLRQAQQAAALLEQALQLDPAHTKAQALRRSLSAIN